MTISVNTDTDRLLNNSLYSLISSGFAVILLLFMESSMPALAETYHVHGTYVWSRRDQPSMNSRVAAVSTNEFDVYVKGDKFAISTRHEFNGTIMSLSGNADSTYFVYRGTNFNLVEVYDALPQVTWSETVEALWFGFASGQYFQTHDKKSMNQIKKVFQQVDRFASFIDTKSPSEFFQHSSLPLPKIARIWVDGYNNAAGFLGRYNAPFDNGYQVITYDTTGIQEAGKIALPLTACYRHFYPIDHATNVTDVVWMNQFVFTVDNVELNAPDDVFVVKADGVQMVSDFRVYSTFPIPYLVTNSNWRERSQLPKPDRDYQRKMELQGGLISRNDTDVSAYLPSIVNNRRARIVFGILSAISTCLLIFWIKYLSKNTTKKHDK